ncbi:hypothetical protein Vau01_121020 [Virgisporangium aurantiacum]|uniref:Uncharacterized protein n=1 Tax=Virgisporangium aurantiacum TaxID=175570 RepID=A0A8J4E7I4_9ACTN|nr:hypothetical protein Vau01_121020 [Virgisporangium aurantiacum]
MYHLVRTLVYHGFLQRWDSRVGGVSTQTYTLGFAILDRARDLSTLLTADHRRRSAHDIADDIANATGRPPREIDRYLAQAAALAGAPTRQR